MGNLSVFIAAIFWRPCMQQLTQRPVNKMLLDKDNRKRRLGNEMKNKLRVDRRASECLVPEGFSQNMMFRQNWKSEEWPAEWWLERWSFQKIAPSIKGPGRVSSIWPRARKRKSVEGHGEVTKEPAKASGLSLLSHDNEWMKHSFNECLSNWTEQTVLCPFKCVHEDH